MSTTSHTVPNRSTFRPAPKEWTEASPQYGGSLSLAQRETYRRDGFLVVEGLLTWDDMAPVRAALNEKVDAIAADLFKNGLIADVLEDASFETRLARLFSGLTDKDFLNYGRSWRDRLDGYYHLMSHPKILDAVESLIGPEMFSNPVYNVRPKVPGVAAGAVPWHQDKSYWPDANANPVITVWIPLVDSTHENGCLHLISGTHRSRAVAHGTERSTGTGYTELPAEFIEERKKEIVALPMTAGSAVLFNDRLVHSSTPNNSTSVRWSVDLRYQPVDQDPMPQHGAGFLARSRQHPERTATLQDWLARISEHAADGE